MPKRTTPKKNEDKKEAKKTKDTLSQDEINSLEQMIKENEVKNISSDIKELLKGQMMEITTPSLKKINPPQKSQISLEKDIITGSITIENEDEGEIRYNLVNKKEEQNYKQISPEYSEIQRESIEKNPNILIKSPSFISQDKINFSDSFPKKNFNLIVEDELKNSKDTDKDYAFKPSFNEKEEKFSRNPFEMKEKKYTKF